MGAYRSEPDKTKITVQKSHQTIQSCICHMCGWRLYMEDSSIQQFNFDQKNNHIFGIFDGHGGKTSLMSGPQVAAFIQLNFTRQLLKNQNYQNENYEKALIETFEIMDKLLQSKVGKEQIKSIQKQMKKKDNIIQTQLKHEAGSTAIVCLITDKFVYVANAGDSKAIGKVKNKLQFLSQDHNPERQTQKQRIQKAGGYIDSQGRINGCLNVSRSIGDLLYKKNKRKSCKEQIVIATPDVKKYLRQEVQMIILGCDGIWQEKTQEQILAQVQKGIAQNKRLKIIVQNLFEVLICKEQQKQIKQSGKDNMSAIVIVFQKKR